jgi:hypothetical protein
MADFKQQAPQQDAQAKAAGQQTGDARMDRRGLRWDKTDDRKRTEQWG